MTAKNFDEAVAIVTAINRIWALRNYEQPNNGVRFLFGWFYRIVVILLFIVIIMYVELYVQMDDMMFNTEAIVYLYLTFIYSYTDISMVVLGWYHSKNALKFRKKISKIDEEFKKLGLMFNYQNMFLRVVVLECFWWLHMIIASGIYMLLMSKNNTTLYTFFVTLGYAYGGNIGSNIIFDFKISLFWLGVRFKQTNELLGSIIEQSHRTEQDIDRINKPFRNSRRSKVFLENRSFNFKHEPRTVMTMLQQIRFVHLQLCCIAKTLNKLFDSQILAYSSLMLIYLTITCYYVYHEIHSSKLVYRNMNLIMLFMFDVLCNMVKLSIVSFNSEYTMKQADKMAEIIHEFSLYEADTELKDEILQFSLQISHAQRGNSKTNFFRLNFNFLRECVSFVTTYLVIIIQWSQNADIDDTYSVANDTVH